MTCGRWAAHWHGLLIWARSNQETQHLKMKELVVGTWWLESRAKTAMLLIFAVITNKIAENKYNN